jgi:hypothetical protein
MEQVHPDPVALVGVIPIGSVSFTVTNPLVAAPEVLRLETTSV